MAESQYHPMGTKIRYEGAVYVVRGYHHRADGAFVSLETVEQPLKSAEIPLSTLMDYRVIKQKGVAKPTKRVIKTASPTTKPITKRK